MKETGMMRVSVLFLAKLLILTLILTTERAIGLPIWFFLVGSLMLSSLENVEQTLITLASSMLLALVFNISFALSAVLMFVLVGSFPALAKTLKSETIRLGVLTLAGSLSVGILSGYVWNWGGVAYQVLSLSIGLLIFKFYILRRRRAPSKLTYSAWSNWLTAHTND